MRLDVLLNKLCLTKTRSIAKNACDKGLIQVNGKPAKASTLVQAEDVVRMKLYGHLWELRISKIPSGNVAKKDAGDYYEVLLREALPDS